VVHVVPLGEVVEHVPEDDCMWIMHESIMSDHRTIMRQMIKP
jgi:hypothetical protein